jgi:5-oxoprolinase (ATP-hydrolysing)
VSRAAWQVWIDTGGTFTDCVAVDPDGRTRCCKVLSTGAIRDCIERIDDAGGVHLRAGSSLPSAFLIGFSLSLLGDDTELGVVGQDLQTGSLRLDADLSRLEVGRTVELRSGEEAPLLAARLVTGTALGRDLPPLEMRLATTRGTNALLERRGARIAHLTTAGFEDLLAIGDQRRPDLFALHIERPAPLPETIVGLSERLAADGSVVEALNLDKVAAKIAGLRCQGFECASVALLHAQRNPRHEEHVEALLREAGFAYVARSSALSPFQGLLRRSQTAAADAYLGPCIADYLQAVQDGLGGPGARLHVMTSAGGLVEARHCRPVDSLLSGPAGGVVGAAMVGRRAGSEKVIGFDMGGTSTDVARFDGDFEYVFEHQVGRVRLLAPALAIETVAAGGGSVCRVDQGKLVVGPQSAGADPGPACYGAGGPLTLTDVNLLLGRLVPSRFPIPIDVDAAAVRFAELRSELGAGDSSDGEAILEGLLRIADERMAEAIRHISVRKGIDPAAYCLVAFGGAGGQHACRVAELLGMEEVMLPGDAGLLSALGLGHAVIERFAQREVLRPLPECVERLEGWLAQLADQAERALVDEGVERLDIDPPRRIIELRYVGQDATVELEPQPGVDLGEAFERRYVELFGYRPGSRAIEVVALRSMARSRRREPLATAGEGGGVVPAARSIGRQRCFLDGAWHDVPCVEASGAAAGATIHGPALILQEHSSLVVPSRWRAEKLRGGDIRVRSEAADPAAASLPSRRTRPRAVELELMSHRFASIAREMGELLRRAAISTNIKEREDFSCTLLDPAGRLVVNAPHIPVHLGAMGLCVRELVSRLAMAPGDVVVTNHPACGGSHLPDVTLAAPVHVEDRLLGYVACRAHHAEIGGIRPGSVPSDARSLAEEGVVIPPTLLVERGVPRWERIEELLTRGPHPTRMLADNLADLRAMLAAVNRGRDALVRLARTVGVDHVTEHMDALRQHAADQARQALRRLPAGVHRAVQLLDDGTPLAAALTIDGERAVLDLGGSGGVHPGNLNATPAIVNSVVMYVMRLLVDADLPLNEGLLDPLELRIPEGLLNPPFVDDPALCPAVVGGNVETSQRLVDTLLLALNLAGCSQGTMNNLSFGDARFGYYETVAGGSGAGSGFDGTSGVHTHMTNTSATDPEVLEHRYPVRLRRFAIRRGSGGAGLWRGGDGLIREIEFLAPLEMSILSQHRVIAPYGMAGGADGEVGRQRLFRPDGTSRELASVDGCRVEAGDRLVLETPGGGGYGAAEP